MARISNEKIIEIRNSVNIIDVVSEYVSLTQKGKNYFGICPFHDDHNPSMSVSSEKQIYTCFVCGATGNVFTFLMDFEHISFLEAVKKIADKTNISLDIGTFKRRTDSHLTKFYEMYDLAMKFYQNNIKTSGGTHALEYLSKRDIDQEIIKEFGIGVSFTGNKIYKTLKASGYNDKDILSSGLCTVNDRGYYDIFSNRIMFPLCNIDGKTVGFSGRIYNSDDSSKYINSKESQIFKKGHLLYNYHRVKEYVRKEGQVIIVEGFIDVIALYKVGIKNVIATMGTAITKEQAQLIRKLSPNVILMFDGDSAGNKATISCSEELLKLGVASRIVRLDNNLDPDDYINKFGLDKLKEHLENPISLIDYKMIVYKEGKNLHNSNDVSNYINEVIKELNLVKDNIVREITIQKLSKETGVMVSTLTSLVNKNDKANQSTQVVSTKKEIKIRNKYQKAYESLLFYMLKYKEVIRLFDESNAFIPDKEYRFLACEIMDFYKKFQKIDIADFIAYLGDKKEFINTLSEIIRLPLPENYIREEIDDYIKVLNEYSILMEAQMLTDNFDRSNSDSDKAHIANQILELKKGVDTNGTY
ncbi:MAG: DNA primase [Bacilli bacterium]|nr:DNA primase [Bacilli bacterium]MDD4054013.1 DNA primase [Bacilli bacterium]MDD4411741.1 DNA primase [Bacilli bacterium]